jgi:alkylated DNA repair protein (DNA oxidative demethylase)
MVVPRKAAFTRKKAFPMASPLTIAPGVSLWCEYFPPMAQKALLDEVLALLKLAPLYRPVMPKSGKPFSVEESNFGRLGWVSDEGGYRYQPLHPVTGKTWPAIPRALLDLWHEIAAAPPPDCCLLNLYRGAAKMGLHQDRDENDTTAPVVSVSLGDNALFRIGGARRGDTTSSVKLASGDVILFGGVARLAYHGIDRITPGSSRLVPGGGRLSLTLRRVGL